jgi:hypothetical protein
MIELLTGNRSACDYYLQLGSLAVIVYEEGCRILGILYIGNGRITENVKKRSMLGENSSGVY